MAKKVYGGILGLQEVVKKEWCDQYSCCYKELFKPTKKAFYNVCRRLLLPGDKRMYVRDLLESI